MNLKKYLPNVMLFMCFLVAGLWAGYRTGEIFKRTTPGNKISISWRNALDEMQTTSLLPGMDANPNKLNQVSGNHIQKNILIIGVNSLDTEKPQLESVWLMMYVPIMPRVTLMPLYPSFVSQSGELSIRVDDDLASAFHLEAGKTPSPDFLANLAGRGLWWNNYIVIDAEGLAEVIDYVGGLDRAGSPARHAISRISGKKAVAAIPSTSDKPQHSLLEQTRVAQELCRSSIRLDLNPTKFYRFLRRNAARINTDMNSEFIIEEFLQLFQHGSGLTCEFPSIMAYHPQ